MPYRGLIEKSLHEPKFEVKWKEVEARISLALLRKEANLTQDEVAKRMGVARPRVAELERRPLSVSFGRMIGFATALGVPIARIVSELKLAS